jgi:hypothetical protein
MSEYCNNCSKETGLTVCWGCLVEGSDIISNLESKLKSSEDKVAELEKELTRITRQLDNADE